MYEHNIADKIMSISKKLIKFLEKEKIKYEPINHRTVYTAYDKSRTLRISQKMVGKTLVLKINPPAGGATIALIPASKNLDKGKFKKVVNNWLKKIEQKLVKNIDFVTEAWMKKNLKGVKIGAIPPFGNLWGLLTFVDKALMQNPEIIVNSGDYNFSIKINSASLKKLVPKTSDEISRTPLIIGDFSKIKK